jgi:hypothetical protein
MFEIYAFDALLRRGQSADYCRDAAEVLASQADGRFTDTRPIRPHIAVLPVAVDASWNGFESSCRAFALPPNQPYTCWSS